MDGRLVVTLLRHGLTKENDRSAYIGWTDCPLSEKGRKMARVATKNVRKEADVIFSSPLIRCVETAKILFPDQPMIKLAAFKEMHFGKWERKTYDQLKGVAAYRHWLDHPFTSGPDGGESFEQFAKRIVTGWETVVDQIVQTDATKVVIVTHGGVIRYLLSYLLKDRKSFFEWNVPFVGGYDLIWPKDQLRRGEACTLLQGVPTMENLPG